MENPEIAHHFEIKDTELNDLPERGKRLKITFKESRERLKVKVKLPNKRTYQIQPEGWTPQFGVEYEVELGECLNPKGDQAYLGLWSCKKVVNNKVENTSRTIRNRNELP